MAGAVINDITKAVVRRRSAGASGAPVSDVVRRRGGDTGFLGRLSVQPVVALDIRKLSLSADPIAEINAAEYAFDGSVLDFDAITTALGETPGLWEEWRDQAGGGAAAQTTSDSRPAFTDRAGPDFDGTDNFMEIPHAANQLLTSGLTIVLGVSPTSTTSSDTLVQKGSDTAQTDGFWLYENGAAALSMRVNSATTATSSAVMTTGFQHWIITTAADGAVNFYRNNVAAGSGPTGACSGITAAQAISLGRRRGDGGYYDGVWDHALIFPGVITADDRAKLFAFWQTYRLPAALGADDWSVADKETDGAVTVTISTLPDDKDSALTDLEYRLDGGSAVSFGAATTGDYDITGLTNDQQYSVQVRAVNSAGAGPWSAAKVVTPTLSPFIYVLDGLESTSIAAARSVRKRLTVDWTGSLIRVRRASDNEELDIGYGTDNLLDTTALAAHIDGTTGHLVTIYDQTGLERHDQQATPSLQPTIAADGTVTWNGTMWMACDNIRTGTNAITAYPFEMFCRFKTSSGGGYILSLNDPSNSTIQYALYNEPSTEYRAISRNTTFISNTISPKPVDEWGIGSGQWAGDTSRIPRLDGTTGTNTDAGTATLAAGATRLTKGGLRHSSTLVGHTGEISDDVIFAAAASAADRAYLEANL